MKKAMYSTDIIWYDPVIKSAIEKLGEKYSNAIPVFGCALSASKYLEADNYDFNKFVSFLPTVIGDAQFFKWHEGVLGALRTFCRLCFVDPALVEAYLGISFVEVANHYEKTC